LHLEPINKVHKALAQNLQDHMGSTDWCSWTSMDSSAN